MKSRLTLAIGFLVVAIAILTIRLSFASLEVSESGRFEYRIDISGLKARNLRHREDAAEAVRKQRAELIKKLIEFAGEKVEPLAPGEYPWHDSKHLAILLLGDLRATEAVPVLLENVEYKNPRTIIIDEPLLDEGGWYPAAESLSKIGMPAVEPTIKKLVSYEPNSMGSRICRWILKEILGVKLARYRLEIEIEQTKDPVVKERLTAALPYFKTA